MAVDQLIAESICLSDDEFFSKMPDTNEDKALQIMNQSRMLKDQSVVLMEQIQGMEKYFRNLKYTKHNNNKTHSSLSLNCTSDTIHNDQKQKRAKSKRLSIEEMRLERKKFVEKQHRKVMKSRRKNRNVLIDSDRTMHRFQMKKESTQNINDNPSYHHSSVVFSRSKQEAKRHHKETETILNRVHRSSVKKSQNQRKSSFLSSETAAVSVNHIINEHRRERAELQSHLDKQQIKSKMFLNRWQNRQVSEIVRNEEEEDSEHIPRFSSVVISKPTIKNRNAIRTSVCALSSTFDASINLNRQIKKKNNRKLSKISSKDEESSEIEHLIKTKRKLQNQRELAATIMVDDSSDNDNNNNDENNNKEQKQSTDKDITFIKQQNDHKLDLLVLQKKKQPIITKPLLKSMKTMRTKKKIEIELNDEKNIRNQWIPLLLTIQMATFMHQIVEKENHRLFEEFIGRKMMFKLRKNISMRKNINNNNYHPRIVTVDTNNNENDKSKPNPSSLLDLNEARKAASLLSGGLFNQFSHLSEIARKKQEMIQHKNHSLDIIKNFLQRYHNNHKKYVTLMKTFKHKSNTGKILNQALIHQTMIYDQLKMNKIKNTFLNIAKIRVARMILLEKQLHKLELEFWDFFIEQRRRRKRMNNIIMTDDSDSDTPELIMKRDFQWKCSTLSDRMIIVKDWYSEILRFYQTQILNFDLRQVWNIRIKTIMHILRIYGLSVRSENHLWSLIISVKNYCLIQQSTLSYPSDVRLIRKLLLKYERLFDQQNLYEYYNHILQREIGYFLRLIKSKNTKKFVIRKLQTSQFTSLYQFAQEEFGGDEKTFSYQRSNLKILRSDQECLNKLRELISRQIFLMKQRSHRNGEYYISGGVSTEMDSWITKDFALFCSTKM